MRWLALLVFLLAVPCRAQVVEVNGGASTLYNAAGASATFHFPQSSLSAGLGYAGGRAAFGLTDDRTWRGWDVGLGDKFFTSSVGLGFVERGVAFTRTSQGDSCHAAPGARPPVYGVGAMPCWKHTSKLTFFVGATGPAYSTPFFAAAISQHFGAGISYDLTAGGFHFVGVAALAGPQHTAVASGEYRKRVFRLAGAGGLLQGARYWNAQADYQGRRMGLDVARTTYQTATVDSAGAAARLGPMGFHASAFWSQGNSGQSVGATAHVGFLQANLDGFISRFGTQTAGSVSESLGRHWRISQYLGQSAGHVTVNFGGGYTGNRFVANVGYQEFYMPALIGQSPFQRALTLTLSFHLPHDSAATLTANVLPTGAVEWGAYGGTFVAANASESEAHPASQIKGGFIIRGIVVDKSGMPVSGAAVSVCGQIAYTNSAGLWAARLRRARPCTVELAPDEFSAPGDWIAQTAAESVQPQPENATTPLTLIANRR